MIYVLTFGGDPITLETLPREVVGYSRPTTEGGQDR
jgi:hypothetical protein